MCEIRASGQPSRRIRQQHRGGLKRLIVVTLRSVSRPEVLRVARSTARAVPDCFALDSSTLDSSTLDSSRVLQRLAMPPDCFVRHNR